MNTTDIIQELEAKMTVDGMAKTRGYVIPGIIAQNDELCACIIERKEVRKETTMEYAKACGKRIKMLDPSARIIIASTWLGVIHTSSCAVAGSVQYICMLVARETDTTFLVYSVASHLEQVAIDMFNHLLQAIKEERI